MQAEHVNLEEENEACVVVAEKRQAHEKRRRAELKIGVIVVIGSLEGLDK
jgi:hypothetical protein